MVAHHPSQAQRQPRLISKIQRQRKKRAPNTTQVPISLFLSELGERKRLSTTNPVMTTNPAINLREERDLLTTCWSESTYLPR